MKYYFNALVFTGIATVATVATLVTGERNFLGTIVFGVFAVADFWSTTKSLWKRYKIETYHGKHNKRHAA